jgi:hypothetical protein
MPARMPARWRRIVRASLTNASSLDLEAHVSHASRCWGARPGGVELVEQAELFFEQERAEHRLVGVLDFAEQRELAGGLFLRGLR